MTALARAKVHIAAGRGGEGGAEGGQQGVWGGGGVRDVPMTALARATVHMAAARSGWQTAM